MAFRRENPFCAECELQGRESLTAVTGHIIPVQDAPELRLEWSNLRPLCLDCNAQAAVMEAYARKHGLTHKLPEWCRDLESRPREFQPVVPERFLKRPTDS